MAWSFRTALVRTGIPAATIFVLWSYRDLELRDSGATVVETVYPIAAIIAAVWIGAAAAWWLASRSFGRRRRQP